jgi:hypothetical protein
VERRDNLRSERGTGVNEGSGEAWLDWAVRCGGFTIECISTPSPWRHCRLIRCSQLSDPYPPGGGDGLLARSVAEDLCGFVDAVGRSKKSGAHSLPLPPYIAIHLRQHTHTPQAAYIFFLCLSLLAPCTHAHAHAPDGSVSIPCIPVHTAFIGYHNNTPSQSPIGYRILFVCRR